MKIYIDTEYKCHPENDGTMREIESDFFDGKCDLFIEGYRFVPIGESYTLPDGRTVDGEYIGAFVPYQSLEYAQKAYEQVIEALEILGVTE